MCGGEGTRLRPLTFERPKPSIPLLNKPSVGHLVEHLLANSFNDIVITLGYLGSNIQDYLGDGSRFGVEITYIYEKEKLGTAGSVKNAKAALGEGPFLVVGGDHVMDFDLRRFYQYHRRNNSILTVGVMSIDDPREYGIVDINVDNQVLRFKEKPSAGEIFSNLASTGIYMCDPQVLDYIPEGQYDFAKNLFPKLIEEGELFSAWMARGHWTDIGNATAYRQASRWLLDNLHGTEIHGRLHIEDAWFNGPALIGTDVTVGSHSALEGPIAIGNNTTIGDSVLISPYTTIGSNCHIGDHTSILSGIIYDNVKIGAHTKISGSVIDDHTTVGAGCILENNTVIGPRVTINDAVTVHSGVLIWPDLTIEKSEQFENRFNEAFKTNTDGS